jgi:hypothetical protein
VLMRFIDHAQAGRREGAGQLFGNDVTHAHVVWLGRNTLNIVERASF